MRSPSSVTRPTMRFAPPQPRWLNRMVVPPSAPLVSSQGHLVPSHGGGNSQADHFRLRPSFATTLRSKGLGAPGKLGHKVRAVELDLLRPPASNPVLCGEGGHDRVGIGGNVEPIDHVLCRRASPVHISMFAKIWSRHRYINRG